MQPFPVLAAKTPHIYNPSIFELRSIYFYDASVFPFIVKNNLYLGAEDRIKQIQAAIKRSVLDMTRFSR